MITQNQIVHAARTTEQRTPAKKLNHLSLMNCLTGSYPATHFSEPLSFSTRPRSVPVSQPPPPGPSSKGVPELPPVGSDALQARQGLSSGLFSMSKMAMMAWKCGLILVFVLYDFPRGLSADGPSWVPESLPGPCSRMPELSITTVE